MGKRIQSLFNGVHRTTAGISVLILAAVLAACSPAPSTPAATPTPAATDTPQQAATPTSLDPCELISSQEASTLAGAAFGAGLEGSTPGGLKMCTYGAQTVNVFTVEVAQAPDIATAKADEQSFLDDLKANLAQLSSQGLQVTQVPNLADGAAMAQASIPTQLGTINGSAIGFRKGTIFFGFSDIVVGGAAPTSQVLQSEATTVMARLL